MKLIVFDTETTGVDAHEADIIQIGAVYMPNMNEISDQTFNTYVQPFSEFRSPEAMRINGISEQTLREKAVPPPIAIQQFYNWCKEVAGRDFHLAGWNVIFDIDFLKWAHLKCKHKYDFPWKTFEAKMLGQAVCIADNLNTDPYKGHGTDKANAPIMGDLNGFAKWLGIEVGEEHKAHDALDDAYLTAEVIKACFDVLKND